MATVFAGKTVLITGAGRGIGRAIALGLADASAGLILLARSAVQLDQTRAMLLDQGAGTVRIRVVAADWVTKSSVTARPAPRLRRAESTSWSTTRPPWNRSASPPTFRPRSYAVPSS